MIKCVMKKSSGTSQKLGSFLSPGAPNYREKSIGSQKGWCSERVSKPSSSSGSISRRHTMAGLTPFCGGRTMPSKWDEAERWICSPVSAYAESRSCSHAQLQRRPKSISGPIVPPGVAAFYSNYSPVLPLRQGLVVRNLVVGSPFSTGVLAPVAVSVHHFDAHDGTVFGYDLDSGMQFSSPVINENGMVFSPLSTAAPTCSELPCNQSSPISEGKSLSCFNPCN